MQDAKRLARGCEATENARGTPRKQIVIENAIRWVCLLSLGRRCEFADTSCILVRCIAVIVTRYISHPWQSHRVVA